MIHWEPELIARIVADEIDRRALAADDVAVTRYRAALARAYELPEGRQRLAVFESVDLEAASVLGLTDVIYREVSSAALGRLDLIIAPVTSGTQEGADLTPRGRKRTAHLRLRPSRFDDRVGLATFVRHEIGHLRDLLDPAFGCSGEHSLHGHMSSEALIRERYRSLWCASVDARIAAEHRVPLLDEHSHAFAITSLFCLSAIGAAQVVAWLRQARPAHPILLACAVEPAQVSKYCPGFDAKHVATQRAHCPICRFPAWPAVESAPDLPSSIVSAVHTDLPNWSPDDGMCGRCVEVYSALGGLAC